MAGIFQRVKTFFVGETPIDVYGGNKGGYRYIMFYNRSERRMLAQYVTPPKIVSRNISGVLTGAGVSATVRYGQEETLGKPFAVINKDAAQKIAFEDLQSKYNQDREGELPLEPAQKYEVEQNDKLVAGPYVVPIAPKNIENPTFEAHFDGLDQRVETALGWLLEFAVKTLWADEQVFRSSIFLHDAVKKELKMRAAYNMAGYKDFGIAIGDGKGAVGEAFAQKKTYIWDLNIVRHEEKGVDSSAVWEDMKSILAVPILDAEGIPLGALSVDTDKGYAEARFNNKALNTYMMLLQRSIGSLLQA